MKDKKVLVLNRNYQPLHVISWQRAFVKLYSPQNPLAVVEYYEGYTKSSAYKEHKVPAVMVVRNKFVNYKRKVSEFGNYRKYVYVRDKHTCQYCLSEFDERSLTVDHVYPRSRGGSNDWENLVTSCQNCNAKKADKLTHEAKMFPKKPPRPLKDVDLMRYYFQSFKVEPEWEPYLKHIL